MTDIFASSKLRLSRGKYHIIDLETRIRAFLEEKPYTISRETEPKTVQDMYKVSIKFTKAIPDDFACIAADAVDNLRSVLDHAWWAIALACGVIKSNEEAYFPIANSLRAFNGMVDRKKCPKNSPRIFSRS